MSKNTFLKGAAILGLAGVLVKILGAAYRIPLGNMMGDKGMGYYQTAYPLYNLMFALSTSGIPIAIAKLVSEKRAIGDYRGGHRIFQVSLIGLIVGGILSSTIVYGGAEFIVNKIGNSNAYYALLALTPALVFVPIMAAFRGYFQGLHTMTPTAISQVFEQLFRVIAGLTLTYVFLDQGLAIAAAGASLGGSIGAFVGATVIIFIYFKQKNKRLSDLDFGKAYPKEGILRISKAILAIAVPITIGAAIVPLMNMVDVLMVMRRLQEIGYTEAQASGLYGQLTAFAQTLINLPQIFSIAISMSLVPAISAAYAKREYKEIEKLTTSGIRVTLLIGFPAAVGLSILATPIIKLLYYNNPVAVQESAGSILRLLAFSVIFLTLVQSLTALLQGIGRPMIPVKNLALGAVTKAILTYTLTGIPGVGIKGAAISTVVAYSIAAILNYRAVKYYIRAEMKIKEIFIGPILSVLMMAVTVWASYGLGIGLLGEKLVTIVAIGMGVIIYGAGLLVTGSITDEDLLLIPKGQKLIGFISKFRVFKS